MTFTLTVLLSPTRPHLVQILIGHYSQELESVCCQLLRGQRGSLAALQDLEVSVLMVNHSDVCVLGSCYVPSSELI